MARVKTVISKRERQDQILNEIRNQAAVRIADLATKFNMSTETIRRDLDWLSQEGLLNRTYGGGTQPLALEADMRDRHQLQAIERARIARAAAAVVEVGEVVMIDAGSTTLHFAAALASLNKRIVVVTNGLSVAEALARGTQIKIIVCPGEFNEPQGGVVGPDTIHFLQRLNANRAFIGASGLTADGPTEADSGIAWVKRIMIERAQETTLLIDHTKFNRAMLEVVCPFDNLSAVITDENPNELLTKAMMQSGVKLTVV